MAKKLDRKHKFEIIITDEFREDFINGVPVDELAEKYGINKWRIYDYYQPLFTEEERKIRQSIIHTNNIEQRWEGKDTKFFPPDVDKFNEELKYMSLRDLEKKYNSTHLRIFYYCIKYVPKEIWEEHNRLIERVRFEKDKKTNLEKYGSIWNTEKTKKTNLERYGFEHPFQSEQIRDKIKQTCLERYGFESPTKSDFVKDKIKQTCLEKYGFEYPAKSDFVKDKRKQTCLDRYGSTAYLQSDAMREKFYMSLLGLSQSDDGEYVENYDNISTSELLRAYSFISNKIKNGL